MAVAELRNQGFRIDMIDIGCNGERAKQYGVNRTPTFVFISGGDEIRRSSGYHAVNQLRKMFRNPGNLQAKKE